MLKSEDISAALARMNPEKRAEAYDLVKEAYARGLISQDVDPFREWLPKISPEFFWDKPYQHKMYDELDLLMATPNGQLILSLPPRHTKTETITVRFSAHFIKQNPKNRVIIGSYNKDLATKFSGKTRAVAREAGIEISKESNAMDEWQTLAGGGVMAAGVGSGVTGNGAELIIIDDPVKSRAEAESETYRNLVWNWFNDDIYSRLQPNGKVIVIMCMTGDTAVSMSDGTYKHLRDVKVGDTVLSYNSGSISSAIVMNHTSQGDDVVYEIKTGNNTVKANARHPFLVYTDNGLKWKRVSELNKGDELVSSSRIEYGKKNTISNDEAWLLGFMFGDGWITKRDTVQKSQSKYTRQDGTVTLSEPNMYPRKGFITCCALKSNVETNERVLGLFRSLFYTEPKATKFGYLRTERQHIGRWFIDHGLEGNAHTKRLPSFLYSEPIDIRKSFLDGLTCSDGHIVATDNDAGRCVYRLCNKDLVEDIRHLARSVGYRPTNINHQHLFSQPPHSKTKIHSDSYAVSWRPETHDTEFVTHRITSIKSCGVEEVFDVQIEGTENFIADGLISHNTRWHTDDLVGRLLASENSGLWRVVNFPALAEENDPLGRQPGEALCEEWYSADRLRIIKKQVGIASFTSLYQGKPTPDEGSRFRAEWFKYYREEDDKYLLAINASSWKPVLKQDVRKFQIVDVAATENKRSDYFVVKTYGITPNRDLLYLDMYREKAETVKHEQIIVSQYNRHRPEWVGIENESYGLALTQTLANSGVPVVKLSADRDKYSRTLTSVSMYEAGRIYHPQGSFWLAENEQELLQFPWGTHDDMVDCDSYAAIKSMDYEKREETDVGEELLPEEDRTLENIEERNAFFRPQDNSQMEGYEW